MNDKELESARETLSEVMLWYRAGVEAARSSLRAAEEPYYASEAGELQELAKLDGDKAVKAISEWLEAFEERFRDGDDY